MDSQARTLVRDSWSRVAPSPAQATEAGLLFYRRLFERDPSLATLFPSGDLTAQAGQLMQMIGVVVAALDRPETVLPAIALLGRRHVAYGVADAHYATVGAVLLDVLAEALGDAFTPATREAWRETYAMVAGVMRRAVTDEPAPASGV